MTALVGGLSSIGRALGDGASALAYGFRRARRGFRLNVPERLLIAPQDIIAGDPVAAVDMYSGQIWLAGRTVQTHGLSPFKVAGPNAAWHRDLHGFAWLRHFRDVDNPVVRQHARALVAEWLTLREAYRHPAAQMPEVAARRMISWLNHSPLLLGEADHAFYHRFMRGLARTVLMLEPAAARPSLGLAQLTSATAFASYTLCAATRENDWKRAGKLLSNALTGAVLADGTPITRNPGDALAIAADLLPLRTAYTARGRTPPPELQAALDRLMALIRLMRHSSGEMALFNGMGATSFDLVGAILQFDDARGGVPPQSARFGGYHRLEAGTSVVLVDTGEAPQPAAARGAHAGVASFELSAGSERIVVNCGAPSEGLTELRRAVRETAAHSTLTVDGFSSSRFRAFVARDGAQEYQLVDAGPRPRVERLSEAGVEQLTLVHDGYQKSCGLTHERSFELAPSGLMLSGFDSLRIDPRRSRSGIGDIRLRFHLHPRVRAQIAQNRTAVRLTLGDGAIWDFEADGHLMDLEESIFLGGLASQRQSVQIVVAMPAAEGAVAWQFIRRAGPAVPVRS